jgi:hypothetical protein
VSERQADYSRNWRVIEFTRPVDSLVSCPVL